jgi:hypothetical protein
LEKNERDKKGRIRKENAERRKELCKKESILLVGLLNHSDSLAQNERETQDSNLCGNFPTDVEFNNPILARDKN